MANALLHRAPTFVRRLACSFSLLLGAGVAAQQTEMSRESPRESPLDAPVRIDFERAEVAEWRNVFERATGVPVVVADDLRGLDAARTRLVGVRLPELPARRALDAIAAICDLHWRAQDGVVVLSVAAPDRAAAVPAKVVTLFGAVRTGTVDVGDGELTLLQVLAQGGWEKADLQHVVLMRPGAEHPLQVEIDVRAMIVTGNTQGNVMLRAGDCVFVPWRAADLGPGIAVPGARVAFAFGAGSPGIGNGVGAAVLASPSAKELVRLTEPQVVDADGRIAVPYVGKVPVRGLDEAQLAAFVQGLLRPVFASPIDLAVTVSPP